MRGRGGDQSGVTSCKPGRDLREVLSCTSPRVSVCKIPRLRPLSLAIHAVGVGGDLGVVAGKVWEGLHSATGHRAGVMQPSPRQLHLNVKLALSAAESTYAFR